MNRQKLPNLPNAAFRAPQRTRNTHQAHVPGHKPVIYLPNKQLDQPKCTKTFPQPASWLLCGLPREVPKIVPMAVGVAIRFTQNTRRGDFPREESQWVTQKFQAQGTGRSRRPHAPPKVPKGQIAGKSHVLGPHVWGPSAASGRVPGGWGLSMWPISVHSTPKQYRRMARAASAVLGRRPKMREKQPKKRKCALYTTHHHPR